MGGFETVTFEFRGTSKHVGLTLTTMPPGVTRLQIIDIVSTHDSDKSGLKSVV